MSCFFLFQGIEGSRGLPGIRVSHLLFALEGTKMSFYTCDSLRTLCLALFSYCRSSAKMVLGQPVQALTQGLPHQKTYLDGPSPERPVPMEVVVPHIPSEAGGAQCRALPENPQQPGTSTDQVCAHLFDFAG